MSDNKYLPSEAVATLDTSRVSNFFVKFCGSREAAVNFLENVIDEIDPSQSIKKKARTGKEEDNTVKNGNGLQPIGPTDSDAVSDIYYRDATDSLNHSFIMLAPNEISINSHMIGKGGSHIAEIKSKTGVRVQLERTESIPAHIFDRNVIFTGELKSICYAFQLMHNRIAEKADGIFQGYSESTKIVVPLELVSHLIGKLGVSIKKVQSDSGARTEIQTEEEMHQQGYYYGRTITISGSLRQRAHAIYLIMRQLALDRELPLIWKGSPPLAIMSPHQAAAASNMSAHMNKNPTQMMAGLMTQPPQYNYPNPAATAAPTTFSYPYGNPTAATNSSPYTTNPAHSTAPPILYPPPASGAPTMYTTNPQQQQQQPHQQQPPSNMYANIPVPNASTYTYGAPGGGGAAGASAPPSYYSQPPPQQSQPQPLHHLQQPPTQQQPQHQHQQLAPPQQQQQQQPQQQAHQPPPWLTSTAGHKRAY